MNPREKADIVDRLRDPEFAGPMRHLQDWSEIDQVMSEAATEIASLRRELAELREDKRIVDELLDAAITDYNEARAKALEDAATLLDEGFDRGIKSKHDTCEHGKFEWEDCELCAATAIRNLAGEKADG